jgi:hypothetical protein
MRQPDANLEEHNAREPLPPRWLELLAKLDTVCVTEVEPSPPTQPEQSGDGNGGGSLASGGPRSARFGVGNVLSEDFFATEPAQQSLLKLLAQLEERMKTDTELERCYGAVDRAVAELVRHRLGRTGGDQRSLKP